MGKDESNQDNLVERLKPGVIYCWTFRLEEGKAETMIFEL